MTDDEMMMFIQLKFGGVISAAEAFAEAINSPTHVRDQFTIPQEIVIKALKHWILQGAPKKLEITSENVDMILTAKFGNIQNAFKYWMHLDPNREEYLSEKEYTRLIDYVDSKTNTGS